MIHFKNDAIKGAQHLPLAHANLLVVTMLEQAAAFYGTLPGKQTVSTLFYAHDGSLYKGPYFSTIAATLMSFHGVRATANTFRHLFTTAWRDFIASPTTQLIGLSAKQLEDAAAAMTLNSPDAWNIAYDDSNIARGIHCCLAMWPKFTEYVHQQHLDKVSEEAWDPLTASLADLTL